MGEKTEIAWCDSTFNPWIGCTKVSSGCDHCYAESYANRYGKVTWGLGQPRHLTSENNWKQPIKWNREACDSGVRRRVFCASLADVFDNEVPQEWRERLFHLIGQTQNLDWLLLTKRIGNVAKMLPSWWRADNLYPNVWLGISVVNQEEADRDIPRLLRVPATIRFLSMEPLLGPVNLRLPSGAMGPKAFPDDFDCWTEKKRDEWFSMQARATYMAQCECIDWVIVGGESGVHARPMHPDWALSLRDQCLAADVPFLFKQWGEWQNGSTFGNDSDMAVLTDGRVLTPTPESLGSADRESPVMKYNPTLMAKVGKKRAGRLLNGREWNELPTGIAA